MADNKRKTKTMPLNNIPRSNKNTTIAVALPEGDNNKFTTFALEIMKLGELNLYEPAEVQQRVIDYFQLCADYDMKPGVAALGSALGLDRRRLWEINNDIPTAAYKHIPTGTRDVIKNAYKSLETLWEGYMNSGKINPVTGIFLAKNNFGYVDKQEHVLTPNSNATFDVKTIENKYDELPD